MRDVELQIEQYLVDNFLFGGDISGVATNQSLLATGVIDSLGVLQLISFAEEQFDIVVEDADVVPENFDSVGNLANYITSKALAFRRIDYHLGDPR
jgi:acyl carrier protein